MSAHPPVAILSQGDQQQHTCYTFFIPIKGIRAYQRATFEFAAGSNSVGKVGAAPEFGSTQWRTLLGLLLVGTKPKLTVGSHARAERRLRA